MHGPPSRSPSRRPPGPSPHLDTRQYARIVDGRVKEIGLDPARYERSKLEGTVRYLGIELDDALEIR